MTDGLRDDRDAQETSWHCPAREDGRHCSHWDDCLPCCSCGDNTEDCSCDCDRHPFTTRPSVGHTAGHRCCVHTAHCYAVTLCPECYPEPTTDGLRDDREETK